MRIINADFGLGFVVGLVVLFTFLFPMECGGGDTRNGLSNRKRPATAADDGLSMGFVGMAFICVDDTNLFGILVVVDAVKGLLLCCRDDSIPGNSLLITPAPKTRCALLTSSMFSTPRLNKRYPLSNRVDDDSRRS